MVQEQNKITNFLWLRFHDNRVALLIPAVIVIIAVDTMIK